MTFIEGGLRSRLIRDSLEQLVITTLTDRGWLDTGRRHSPIRIIPEPQDWNEPIEINSMAISGGDSIDDPMELGSNLTEDTWTYYVDFYGEDESIAIDVMGDLRDSFRGKLPSIGRTDPTLPVYDFREDPPVVAFYCDLENVVFDRGRGTDQPWLRYWFALRVDVVDEYD